MPHLWSRLPLPEQHVAGLLVGLALDRVVIRRWPPAARPLGLALAAVGLLINAEAVRSRGSDQLDRPTALVRGGPYAWSRNPMYVGWSLLHLGIALSGRSPGMSITWPVAVLLVHREIRCEERQLVDRFGADFTSYAATVPRYLDRSAMRTLIGSVRARARTQPPRSGRTRRA